MLGSPGVILCCAIESRHDAVPPPFFANFFNIQVKKDLFATASSQGLRTPLVFTSHFSAGVVRLRFPTVELLLTCFTPAVFLINITRLSYFPPFQYNYFNTVGMPSYEYKIPNEDCQMIHILRIGIRSTISTANHCLKGPFLEVKFNENSNRYTK